MNPIIVTDRSILRRPRASDWPAVRAFLLSNRSGLLGFERDEQNAWLFYSAMLGHWDLCDFGIFVALSRDTQEPAGLFGPWFPATWPEPEMVWHLFCQTDEGSGLATECAKAVLDHLFTNKKFNSIASFVEPTNTRSLALAKRLGATPDTEAEMPNDPRRPTLVAYRHKRPA